MTAMQHMAYLHPRTVTQVSQTPPRRHRRSYGRRPGDHYTETRVHPAVWQAAVRACRGVCARIEVVSTTEVRIHNDPEWRKKRYH